VGDIAADSQGVPAGWTIGAVLLILALSPLLAGWAAALTDGVTTGWWRPRPVNRAQWGSTAGTAAALTVAAAAGRPWAGWLILAATGAVLIVVDLRTHRLPARLVYPTAGVLAVVLILTTVLSGDTDRLLRAAAATAAVGTAWFLLAFLAPAAIGLGDVRLFAVTAGLLGWTSWPAVIAGQLLAFLIAGITALVVAVTRPRLRGRRMPVPMGPGIIVGAFLAAWSVS
jgi:leader peptidase (prepilin peptidase)/N-methyltransferase